MALYDNKLWALSHIYHSFTQDDHTGVSEIVLTSGTFKEDLRTMAENQGKCHNYLPIIIYFLYLVNLLSLFGHSKAV